MHRRQSLPRLWLMTDERQGDALWTALAQLPRGSGVVFRHYGLGPRQRHELFERVKKIARRRRLLLLLAGTPELALAWRADGSHGRAGGRCARRLKSAPAHDLIEIRAAERAGADLLFLSPVFPTRSHPGGRVLGPARFATLARATRLPVIALGGMDGTRARSLRGHYGWAGISAWGGSGRLNIQRIAER